MLNRTQSIRGRCLEKQAVARKVSVAAAAASRVVFVGVPSKLCGIHLDGQDALYLQLYRALRRSILAGDLGPASRLPATRNLARDLGVSRNVVLQAYDQLYAEGYVSGHVGVGTFVAAELPDALLQVPVEAGQVRDGETPRRLSRFGPTGGRASGR